MDSLFLDCSSLSFLPDISKWDTYRVESIDNIFNNCISLAFFPDLSKWNFRKLKIPENVFFKCLSLSLLPDNFFLKIYFFKMDFRDDCINCLNSFNLD